MSFVIIGIEMNKHLTNTEQRTECEPRDYQDKRVNPPHGLIERFLFECRKVIGFALSTLYDWLKRFAPLFRPIRSTTKTNRDAFARIFLRFASATVLSVFFVIG